jgi:hypothetical protein
VTALVHKARKFLKCNADRPTDTEDKSIKGMAINNLKETEAKSKCNEVNPSSFEIRDEELVKRISFRAENFIECVEATALYDTVLWYVVENTVFMSMCGFVQRFMTLPRLQFECHKVGSFELGR